MGGDIFCFDWKFEFEWIFIWSLDVELCVVLCYFFGIISVFLSFILMIWLGDLFISEILLGLVCVIDGLGVSCGRSWNNGGCVIK